MSQDSRQIDVGFPAERSISEWERRHRNNEVPGRWPYGLDALGAFAPTSSIDLPVPSKIARARDRLGIGPRERRDNVGVTWDENAALRMATSRPYASHVSGVIWLTDAAARGRDLGRLPAVLAECAALWVLSDAQIDPLRRIVSGPPVEYVRFGIDHSFFTRQSAPSLARVVSVGGDRDRDTQTLFRALDGVHAARPDVELVVQTATDLTPPDGVHTIRHLPHEKLRELYASASLVAIATRPNLHVSGMTVSLEAMATGRPVAVTRTPGMADYIEAGVTGLLSEPGDAEALSSHILELLDDPARTAEMGAAGRRSVEQQFTSELMAEAIYEIVREYV